MASFDYAETAQDALDIMVEFGDLATVTSTETGAYDAATSTASTTTASVTVYGVIFDLNFHTRAGNHPDALVRTGDRQLLLAALDTSGATVTEAQLPVDATVVAPDGDTYTIKNVMPLAPAGVPVMFDILVRRPGG